MSGVKVSNCFILTNDSFLFDKISGVASQFSFENIFGIKKSELSTLNLIQENSNNIVFVDKDYPKSPKTFLNKAFISDSFIVYLTQKDDNTIKNVKHLFHLLMYKPVDEIILEKILSLHLEKKPRYSNPALLVRDNKRIYAFPQHEIIKIKSIAKDTLEVHHINQIRIAKTNIGRLEQRLNPKLFFRVNQSTTVNINFITEIESQSRIIYLADGSKEIVSVRNKTKLYRFLQMV